MTKRSDSMLSPDGEVRRAQMRADLMRMMHRRSGARATRRRVGLMALLTVLASLSMHAAHDHGPPTTRLASEAMPAPVPVLESVIVQTRTGLGEHYAPRVGSAVRIERIDDRQLVRDLAAMNRPTGLIRIADRVHLTHALPPDAERRPSDDLSSTF